MNGKPIKQKIYKPQKLEKDLFKAAMFAKKLIEDNVPVGLAHYRAGQYYGYSASDVAWARTQLKQPKNRADRG